MNILKAMYRFLYLKDLKEIMAMQDTILEDLRLGKGLKPLSSYSEISEISGARREYEKNNRNM